MPLPRAYIKFSICHSLFHIDMKKLCPLAGGEGGGYPMITIMSRSVLPSRCPQHLITALITAAASPGHPGHGHPNILGHAPIFPSQAPLPGSSSRPPAARMQNICQHTPPPAAAAAAAAADGSQTQRRGQLQFAVTRKNGPCKIDTNTLSHNMDRKYTTNQTVKYWHYF